MSNELQTQEQQGATVWDALRDPNYIAQLALAAPRDMDPQRLARIAFTVCRTNPKLYDCTRESLLHSVMLCAQTGLEPGPMGHCAIIPYGKEAQWQPMYKGLLHLIYRSEKIVSVSCEVVYENDEFDFDEGSSPFVKHQRALGDRGEHVIAAYACLHPPVGPALQRVMSFEELDTVRTTYSKDTRRDAAWVNEWDEMACKTVLKRCAKRAPLSIETQVAIGYDDLQETGKPQVSEYDPDFKLAGEGACNLPIGSEGLVCSLPDGHLKQCEG